MFIRVILLVFLFVATAQASELTDKVSDLLLKNKYDEAKETVMSHYQDSNLSINYGDLIAAVTNVSRFYRNYDKWKEMFVNNSSNQELLDFYKENLVKDFDLLNAKPLPFKHKVVAALNDKMKSAQLNAKNYANALNKERNKEKQVVAREEARLKALEAAEEARTAQAAVAAEAKKKIFESIKGVPKACSDLPEMMQAAEQGDTQYFHSWKISDFNKANSLQQRCEDGRSDVFNKVRNNAVNQLNKLIAERKQAEDSCHSKKQYLLYQAQENIIDSFEQLAGWEANRAKERRISKESGVRNLSEEYNNGAWIVQIRETIKEEWTAYKKFGGKASTPKGVKHTAKNPCATIEAETESAKQEI